MNQTTAQLRQTWEHFGCRPETMTVIDFGPDRIRIAPPTADAWRALACVFEAHDYQVRLEDTDSYNCRTIKGGSGKSLHSFGIALDVNWHTNPFKETPDNRAVRYSDKPTQAERGQDVRLGHADTDMTPELIQDIAAIRTKGGKTVFGWGGAWKDRKDAMHFEIDVTPAELAEGIDWNTVRKAPSDGTESIPQAGVLTDVDRSAPSSPPTGASAWVREFQIALRARNYPVGDIDGIAGPLTRAAISSFQAASGLPITGIADDASARALGLKPASNLERNAEMTTPQDILRLLIDALAAKQTATPQGAELQPIAATGAPDKVTTRDLIQVIIGALSGAQPASGQAVQPAPTTSPTGTTPPVLSPIDKALGGEALTGKKTALSVVAYAALSIMQAFQVVGTATGPDATKTGTVLTTLIAAFAGLGLLGKTDRLVQIFGLMAAKPKPK